MSAGYVGRRRATTLCARANAGACTLCLAPYVGYPGRHRTGAHT